MLNRERQTKQRKGAGRWLLALALVAALAADAGAAQEHRFANGIAARIHTAEELLAAGGLPDAVVGGPYELSDDPSDWYPFDVDEVVAALADMRGFATEVTVDVYVLPTPPVTGGRSWSLHDAIFLVPGFGPVDAETVAYITTHEMGHVLTWARVDAHPDRWQRYLDARDLETDALAAELEHAWMPREILAEDLRYLFGGYLATITGSIENHDLPTPDRIPGLRELLAGYLADREVAPMPARSRAYPNPCNPRTTIRLELPVGSDAHSGAELRIFDLRGSLVRRLTGYTTGPGVVEISWDGRDGLGGAVASGRYLYVIETVDLVARGAVTLVR